MNTTTAQQIAREFYLEHNMQTDKVEFDAIFVPQLDLQDIITVDYRSKIYQEDSTKWKGFLWGKANWYGRLGYNINIQNKDFTIKKISHDINNFSTKIVYYHFHTSMDLTKFRILDEYCYVHHIF